MLNEQPGKAGVAILGMSRSGTSVVAGMFREAGYHAGAHGDLMGPDEYNSRGYHENLRFHAENQRILEQAGGSWFHPPPADRLASGDGPQRLGPLLQELRGQAAGRPVVIKDPRLGVLLPVWRPFLDELLHPILVIRDPIEIAMSLAQRDGIPVPVGLAGWEVHMTELLAGLGSRPVTVVSYEAILDDPAAAPALVGEVARFIDPALLTEVEPARAANAVEPGLRRNRLEGDEHSRELTGFQLVLWGFLTSLKAGTTLLDVPAQLQAATPMARQAAGTEGRHLAVVEELKELRSYHDHILAELERCRTAYSASESELATARASGEAASAELERVRNDQERLTEAHRALEDANRRLTEHQQALQAERDSADHELRRLAGILETVTRSSSWRVTRPLREVRQALRDRQPRK